MWDPRTTCKKTATELLKCPSLGSTIRISGLEPGSLSSVLPCGFVYLEIEDLWYSHGRVAN